MDVLQIVDAKVNGVNAIVSPTQLQLAIDEVEQAIKNYCNIDTVPEQLKFVWANMSVDLIRFEQASGNQQNNAGLDDIGVNEISSLKIGDTTINLGSGSSVNAYNRAIKSHTANLDELVMNYREQLQKYKRMVW